MSGPDAVRTVFTGPADVLEAGRANALVEPIVGSRSMLVVDGAPHRSQRQTIGPLFQGDRLDGVVREMERLSVRAFESWPVGQVFPLLAELRALTLRIMLFALLGIRAPVANEIADRGLNDSESDDDRLFRMVSALMRVAGHPFLLVPALERHAGPLTPWTSFRRLYEAVGQELRRLFARARADPGRPNMLGELVHLTDERGAPLSDDALQDLMMTLLVAGHETSATALAWAAYHTLARPDLEAALRAEFEEAAGDGPLHEADIESLSLLNAVLLESLRLNPPIAQVGRILARPFEVGGFLLPAGVGVVPSIHLAHREPASWPTPERFDPLRFLGLTPDRHRFFPFGGGARRCLGEAFAMRELRVVLGTIVRSGGLRLAPAPPVRVTRQGVIFAPSGGVSRASASLKRPGGFAFAAPGSPQTPTPAFFWASLGRFGGKPFSCRQSS